MRWLPYPNLRESLQKTIEHQIRRQAQVMAMLEIATQTQRL
jgi:spore coat protein CotF